MRRARAAALLLLLAAAPAAAQQDEPASELAPETDPAVIAVRDKLKNDPAALDAAAARLARSRLIAELQPEKNAAARLAAAREWIKSDPDSAAHIALGLARDDASGKTEYEDALLMQFDRGYEAFGSRGGGVLRNLRKAGRDTTLLQKQSGGMSEDEKAEIMRTMFEGQGEASGLTATLKDDGKASPSGGTAAASATAFNGIYDRLSAGNLRGYSPQLLALQNALNARRPPGAPALVETGRLDYATLSYPAYAMDYDAGNLEKRLKAERILELARLAGRTLTAKDQANPDLESELTASVPAGKLPARLERRAELVAKTRAALAAFLAAAAKAKNPNAVSRGLLVELGARQKETARWIAAAALEEELSRADELDGFLTPELLAAVAAAPAPADERDAYRRRGEALKEKVARVKANAEKALDLLQSDAWASSLAEVDRLVAENRNLKRGLPRDVGDYSRVPFDVADSLVTQPRWRKWADDLAVKWAPTLAYSRAVAFRRGLLARSMNVFGLIASGDADSAHAALAAVEPGRR